MLIVHGTLDEVERAKSILDTHGKSEETTIHKELASAAK